MSSQDRSDSELDPTTLDGVAVVGMSLRFPGANSVQQYWDNLLAGRESIQRFSDDDLLSGGVDPALVSDPNYVKARGLFDGPTLFDPSFFGISTREAELMDPQHRVFLECCWSALEDAGHVPSRITGNVGVWGGMSTGMTNNTYLLANLHSGGRKLEQQDLLPAMLGNENDYLTTRVSFKLNLRGPSVNVQTACSTSLVAIAQAYQSLMLHGCDMALAGGVSVSFPQHEGYVFQEGGIGSPDGHCRPFDAKAQGTVFSNGVGVVVLKRLGDALSDRDTIYAVVRGAALNIDGSSKMSFAAPSVDGQAEVISMAQALADVDPDTVTYVECHGTATPIGDPIEVAALTKAFQEGTARTGFCAIGSVKSNFGHLDSAAGVAAFIKTVLALKHGKIPPTLHYQSPNPQIDFDNSPFYVADRVIDWQPACGTRRAGVSAFGIGGTNAHVVLEQPPLPERVVSASQGLVLIPLSGRTAAAASDNGESLVQYLTAQSSEVALDDVAFTLQQGRETFRHRICLVAGNPRDAAEALRAQDRQHVWAGKALASGGKVALLLPGGGSQYVDMGRALLARFPSLHEDIERGLSVLHSQHGVDLRSVWFPESENTIRARAEFERPSLQLPAIFILEVALARLWQSFGVRFDALLGHSLGENSAACIAGVMDYEQALGLVRLRGELFERVPAGGMLSVALSADDVAVYLGDELDLATVNAPEQCTISGTTEALAGVARRFDAQAVDYQHIPISIAAHSRLLDPILDEFHGYLQDMALHPPQIPIVSNLTGDWLTEEQACSPDYWTRHLRSTVRFSEGIERLQVEPERIFLECGPGRILGSLARLSAPEAAARIVSSLRHPADPGSDEMTLLQAASQLWVLGASIDFDVLHPNASSRRVPLPTYAFQRQEYLIEPLPLAGSVVPAARPPEPLQPDHSQEISVMQSRLDLIVVKLKKIFHDLSGIPEAELDIEESFLDMGFDSLFLTQANLKIKKEFKVKINFRQLFDDAPTINALGKFIDGQLPADALQSELAVEPAAPGPPAQTPEPTSMRASQVSGSSALQRAIQLQIQASNALLELIAQGGGDEVINTAPTGTRASDEAVVRSAPQLPTPNADQVRVARALGPYKPIDNSASSFKLSDAGRRALEEFIDAYSRRTAKSKQLAEDQRPYLSDPRSISNFRQDWKEIVYQIAAGKGSKGSRVFDLDGNEYLDLTSGFGINLFGYSPQWAVEAAHEQIDEGIELGTLSPKALEAAKLVRELTGMERCTFANTGSEAISAAIRAARTVTGKDMIAVFYDEYHGISDEVLVNLVKRGDQRQTVPTAPGIPQNLVDQVLVLEWNDPNCMELIRAHGDELAAVIVEPVQNRNPSLKTSLRFGELREVTRECGIALMFDEMITGFRLAPGGAQEYFGVEADIVCYGKIVAGGMAAAIVAGRGEYLDCFDGGQWQFGDDSFPEAGVTFFGGTYTRHPIALATTVAALRHIREFGADGYRHLNARARTFANQLNEMFVGKGFPARIENCETIFNLKFNDDNPMSRLIFWQLRHRGVAIYDRPFFIATTHSDADFEFVLQQFADSIDFLQRSEIVPVCSPEGEYGTEKYVPFNTAQAEVYLATELGESASRAFHEQVIYDFEGLLDLATLRHAVQRVVFKHDALRARFDVDGGGFIVAPALHLPVELIEVQASDDAWCGAEKVYRQLLNRDFELTTGPLIRFTVVRHVDEGRAWDSLIITAHHVIVDGWSMGIVLKDLANLYSQVARSERCAVQAGHQIGDFLEEEQGYKDSAEYAEDLEFWKQAYQDGIPEPVRLPLDHPRPDRQQYRGARHGYRFGKELTSAVRKFSNEQGCTVFTTLFTAFTQYLARITGQHDLVVAIPMAGQATVGMPELVGHSVSFLPLRVRCRAEPFAAALSGVRELILDTNDHQRFTYLDLIRVLSVRRDPRQAPLAPISFNVDQGMEPFEFDGMTASYRLCPRDYVKNDMFFNLVEEADEYTLELDRNSDLIDAATVDAWVAQFKTVVERVIADPDVHVADMVLHDESEAETRQLEWNDTECCFADHCANLVSAFEASVARHEDRAALMFEGSALTYAELDLAANRVANALIEHGICAEDRVALVMDRSIDLVVAVYGILKAGGAYVPVDGQSPVRRVREVLEDCGAKIVVTQDRYADLIPPPVATIVMDDPAAAYRQASAARPETVIRSNQLAYVIYTSGTTGTPKGVMNEHGAVMNRLLWGQELFQMSPDDRHILKTPYTFDVSVPELFWPLQIGATLVVARPDGHRDEQYLYDLIKDSGASYAHFVPSMLHAFLQRSEAFELPDLRQVHCTGEVLSAALRDQFFERLPGVRLFNLYGPTEAAVEVSAYECRRDDSDTVVSIGRPSSNCQLFVLDDQLRPLPVGSVGELYIGGAQVARGYLNRAELTAERFVSNPMRLGGDRLYRSGDLARLRSDGELEFLGRDDGQVKLRGHRIELAEIEAAMNELPDVRASAAAVHSFGESDQRLIGFVQFEEGADSVGHTLRKHLGERLPSYMLPQFFVPIAELPLTTSGKLDRNALSQMSVPGLGPVPVPVPPSGRQAMVARLWSESIKIDVAEVSAQDNFFDLGGHSLLAMEVLRRIDKVFGKRLSLQDILYNSLEEFAGLLPQMSEQDMLDGYERMVAGGTGDKRSSGVVRKLLGMFSQG